jgi:hypothetical protein
MPELAKHLPEPEFIRGPIPGVITTWEYVTPEKALAWLQAQNELNRPMQTRGYDPLTKDMAEGRFQVTHQGIGFDVDEQLTDGQHRLQSIVNSGKAQWLMVTRGLPVTNRSVIDCPIPRGLAIRMMLAGFKWASPVTIATLRRMLASFARANTITLRAGDAESALRNHGEALTFSEDCFRTTVRGITLSSVRAVIARAFYTGELERVRAFAEVLVTGMTTDADDQPAIMMRNNLLMTPSTSRGEQQQLVAYKKTERALLAFLAREQLSRLYEASRELFPLPEELEQATVKRPRKGRS